MQEDLGNHIKNISEPDKYETLIEKIIQLAPEDCPKFLSQIKVKCINKTGQIKDPES